MEAIVQPVQDPVARNEQLAQAKGLLERMAASGKPVLLEIEQTSLRFRARVTLKDGKVILTKPPALKIWPEDASHVRLRVVDPEEGEIRLKVIAPHAELAGGGGVLICAEPDAVLKNQRVADRFGVSHHASLTLEARGRTYRLTDLSARGCRIALESPQQPGELPVGHVIAQANLMLGATVWVRLLMLVPRAHHGRTVGCEFKTARDELSVHNLSALIESLQQTPIATFMGSEAARGPGMRKRVGAR